MLSAWSDPRVRMLRERLPHGTLVSAGQPDFGVEMVLGEERVND